MASSVELSVEAPIAAVAPVCLDYIDLISGKDLSAEIETAYGRSGLGILTVKNVPGYVELRKAMLPLSWKFANLPDDVKARYEHAESQYNFGWSHGKEKLEGGRKDFAKGSYYANPQMDEPTQDEQLIREFPHYFHPNVWPKTDLPEFEHAFKALGSKMVEVGVILARSCDRFVNKLSPSYPLGKLSDIIATSNTCKARLLNYFPTDGAEIRPEDRSSWCGWHNDHGSLTGLCSAMYINSKGEEVPNPDPTCGLYIRNRAGTIIKANIPVDHIAFQIGESAQIHSAGLLAATPHSVQAPCGPAAAGISRCTYACFMQPRCEEPMSVPEGSDDSHVDVDVWRKGQNFREFAEAVFNKYYTEGGSSM